MPVIQWLNDNNYHIWYDNGIHSGEFASIIAEKLEKATCVIAFLSDEYIESINCRNEINYAIKKNKVILHSAAESIDIDGWVLMGHGDAPKALGRALNTIKLISCGFNMDTAHRTKDEMQAPRTWKSTPSQKTGCFLSMPEYSPYSFNPCPDKCCPLQTLRRCR